MRVRKLRRWFSAALGVVALRIAATLAGLTIDSGARWIGAIIANQSPVCFVVQHALRKTCTPSDLVAHVTFPLAVVATPYLQFGSGPWIFHSGPWLEPSELAMAVLLALDVATYFAGVAVGLGAWRIGAVLTNEWSSLRIVVPMPHQKFREFLALFFSAGLAFHIRGIGHGVYSSDFTMTIT